MGKLANYAATKDKLDKAIADETRRLCLEGLCYRAALRQAKEMYEKATKDTDQDSPR